MSHLRYLKTVLAHKWFVLVAGLRIGGVPLRRLLVHDVSKFSRAEWPAYAARYGTGGPPRPSTRAWEAALEHHYACNDHHWEHWLIRVPGRPRGARAALPMPDEAAREMVADWMAAGRAYTGRWDAPAWYRRNAGRIVLHPTTRYQVEAALGAIDGG